MHDTQPSSSSRHALERVHGDLLPAHGALAVVLGRGHVAHRHHAPEAEAVPAPRLHLHHAVLFPPEQADRAASLRVLAARAHQRGHRLLTLLVGHRPVPLQRQEPLVVALPPEHAAAERSREEGHVEGLVDAGRGSVGPRVWV